MRRENVPRSTAGSAQRAAAPKTRRPASIAPRVPGWRAPQRDARLPTDRSASRWHPDRPSAAPSRARRRRATGRGLGRAQRDGRTRRAHAPLRNRVVAALTGEPDRAQRAVRAARARRAPGTARRAARGERATRRRLPRSLALHRDVRRSAGSRLRWPVRQRDASPTGSRRPRASSGPQTCDSDRERPGPGAPRARTRRARALRRRRTLHAAARVSAKSQPTPLYACSRPHLGRRVALRLVVRAPRHPMDRSRQCSPARGLTRTTP